MVRFAHSSGQHLVLDDTRVFVETSGNPAGAESLGKLLFVLFFTPRGENDKYAKHVRSSPGIAIFVSAFETPASWIEVGRCYERFALQSAALGIRNAMLNQSVGGQRCDRSSLPSLASTVTGRIWRFVSVAARSCRRRCDARWKPFWYERAIRHECSELQRTGHFLSHPG